MSVELQTSVHSDEHLPFLTLLFSAEALKPQGSVHRSPGDSRRLADQSAHPFAATDLRRRIAAGRRGMAQARNHRSPAIDLDRTCRMPLTVFFRLLVVAYARIGTFSNAIWRGIAGDRSRKSTEAGPGAEGTGHWDVVVRAWTAVERRGRLDPTRARCSIRTTANHRPRSAMAVCSRVWATSARRRGEWWAVLGSNQ